MKWKNVPIPEAHLIGLVIGIALQIFLPISLFQLGWIRHAIGWPLIIIGIALCFWSVLEAEDMSIASPNVLLTGGPYGLSRNPMYVGWTFLYLGISFTAESIWMIIFLPAVIIYVHFVEIRKEEQQLDERFGEEYRQYRKRVRRYF